MAKKTVVCVGDVFRIYLPKGRYAFGCVLRDASVGIYPGIFTSPDLPADLAQSPFAFVTGIYADVLASGACPIIGQRTFQSEDEEWPPPQCALDPQRKTVSIYHKGQFMRCKPEDVVGLELVKVCELQQIAERILRTQRQVD